MPYKEYTRQMLANHTGRPLVSFPEAYVTGSAIPQALLLFKIGTCLASPDELSDDSKQLVDFAILAMADAIHLSAPYQTALASPFSSESIGSYSYSKVAGAVQSGIPTGIGWFDIAISELSVCNRDAENFSSGGIEVFEHGAVFGNGTNGNVRIFTPGELEMSRRFGYDPAPKGGL